MERLDTEDGQLFVKVRDELWLAVFALGLASSKFMSGTREPDELKLESFHTPANTSFIEPSKFYSTA